MKNKFYKYTGNIIRNILVIGFIFCLFVGCTDAKVFDVKECGARGNGKALDTEAIQKALDECGKAGGGIVRFTAGTYLSKPIYLHSKTTLQLEKGAMLKATDDPRDFLKPGVSWQEGWNGNFIHFIQGEDLTDVTITGKGIIDGSGERWWIPAEAARRKTPGYTLPRPNLIVLEDCKNVRLENITLQNSPKFHFVPKRCEDVVVSNVTIISPAHAPNSDAIDPNCSKNVLITKCYIDVGDDNVAIKSGQKVEGREFACEDITITDCVFLNGHGVSIGSETNGGVRNVTLQNCTFENTENGLRIKSNRTRGGLVENIEYSNITMKNVIPAITLTCQYGGTSAGDPVQLSAPESDIKQPVTETTPIYRNIRISNLTATCQNSAGIIEGLPESLITNITLENVHISAETGLTISNATDVKLQNVKIETKQGKPLILENATVKELKSN